MNQELDIRTPTSYSSTSIPNFGDANPQNSTLAPKLNIKTPYSDFMSDSLIGSFNKATRPTVNIPTPQMSDLFMTPDMMIGGVSEQPVSLNIATPPQVESEYIYVEQQPGYQTVPQQASPQYVSPQQANPQYVSPQQASPQYVSPQQANPQYVSPQQANPQYVSPQEQVYVEVATPQSDGFTDSIKNMYNTTTDTLKKNKQLSYWIMVVLVLLIIIAIFVVSIIISIIDTGVDAVDAGVDAAGTTTVGGYVFGLATGVGDLATEVILEAIQTVMIGGLTIILTNSPISVKVIKIIIIILCAVIDILASVIMVVIPYGDIAEVIIELITEIIQNLVLVSNIFAIF